MRTLDTRHDGVALALTQCQELMDHAIAALRGLPDSPALGVLCRLARSFPNIH